MYKTKLVSLRTTNHDQDIPTMVMVSVSKGPSHEEWEANRDIITQLYKTTTAANVREVMRLRGFKAT